MSKPSLDFAHVRCAELLELAKQTWPSNKEKSRKFVKMAFKLAMHHRLKLGRKLFCKKCLAPFVHGSTLRVRTTAQKAVVWKCVPCGNELKFPLKKRR